MTEAQQVARRLLEIHQFYTVRVYQPPDDALPYSQWRNALDGMYRTRDQDVAPLNKLLARAVELGMLSEDYNNRPFNELHERLNKEIA
jgi:hypothetical protein